jgi:SPX domain protein involved in polyphosphate accumulation
MKFGEYLNASKVPEWENNYLDYSTLKKIIKQLEEKFLTNPHGTGEKGSCYTM